MKNCLKLLVMIILIFTFTQTQAQFKFGIRGGLNMSSMTFKTSGIALDPSMVAGFHIGAITEIGIAGNLKIQPGILYSSKGTKYESGGNEMKISPQVVEIPINLAYRFDLGGIGLSINAGPYLAFGIGGTVEDPDGSFDISFGSTDENDMKPLDYGLNLGASIYFGKVFVTAQYGVGLANLWPATSLDGTMKMGVIGLSVGYFFVGK
jgi:hypothetical protein